MSSAVNQAAPVLANLRNLAIAEHRAATDGLTGLPERPLGPRDAAAHGRPGRAGPARPLSAVALDLDHFKALNDRHGHQAGDEALAAVGAALRSGVRASDFAGRWGGEEFVLLLPDTDAAGAVALAEKLRELIAAATVPQRADRRHRQLRRRRAARARARRRRASCAPPTARSTRRSRRAATASSSLPRPARPSPDALRPMLDWARSLVVGVAQLVELRVVVPAAAGSSPVAHP